MTPLSRVDFPCWTNLKSSYDAVDPRGRIPMVETVPYRKLFQKRCPASFCWAQKYRQIPPNFRCCIWTFISFFVFFEIIYSNYLPYTQHLQPNNNLNWAFHCWDSRTSLGTFPGTLVANLCEVLIAVLLWWLVDHVCMSPTPKNHLDMLY